MTCARLSIVLAGFLLAVCGLSCSDKDRRMSEFEALNYRRELVRTNHAQLSPQQRRDLMYHPARTQGEIDASFERYRQQFAEQQARDAVTARVARRGAGEQTERLSGFSEATAPGVDGRGDHPGDRPGHGRGRGTRDLPASLSEEGDAEGDAEGDEE